MYCKQRFVLTGIVNFRIINNSTLNHLREKRREFQDKSSKISYDPFGTGKSGIRGAKGEQDMLYNSPHILVNASRGIYPSNFRVLSPNLGN